MKRVELVMALRGHNTPDNTELIRHITSYLQHEYDPEIYRLVERSFGMDFAALQNHVRGGGVDDFTKRYKGECAWLRAYLELTSQNEAPGILHALSVLAVVSCVIGRKTWIPMGFYDIYPPMGVILVGPSGARKTVAISIATKLFDMMEHDVNIIRERFTPEALILALNPKKKHREGEEERETIIANHTAMVISPEMSVTFGKSSYLEGLVPLFTRLMDHEGYEVRTKGGGVYVLTNIALGFLGATTVDWMTTEMTESVIKGGFTSRFLIGCIHNSPRLIYRHTGTPSDKLRVLAEELDAKVQRLNGAFRIEPTADSFMEQWYAAHRLKGDSDGLGSGYHSRKHVHILRLALNLAVLHDAESITMEHIVEAIDLLDYLEPGMLELFGQLTASTMAKDAQYILDVLRRNGGILPRTVILQICAASMGLTRYNEALAYLHEVKYVFINKGKVSTTPRSKLPLA